MTKEYLAVELCEQFFNGINEKTFRRNKKKYIADLKAMGFNVTEGKRGKFTTYILEPVEKTPERKANDEFLKIIGCDIGDKNIELLKFILKSILEKKIVPTRQEIANNAWHAGVTKSIVSEGTITNYNKFFYDNNVLVPAMATPVWIENPVIRYKDGKRIETYIERDYDKETGEILPTYHKLHVNWIYYDYGKDGITANRERLNDTFQKVFHETFQKAFAEAYERYIFPLIGKMPKSFIAEETTKLRRKVMRNLGKEYGIHACERIAEPIINIEIAGKLKEYFGLNQQQEKNIEIDVSNIDVVEINRPAGTSPTAIEREMEYHFLIKSRVKLHEQGKHSLPLDLYYKWHGEATFDVYLNSTAQFEIDDNKPVIDLSESLERHETANEIALEKNEANFVSEESVAEPDFEKQLNAYIFKGKEATEDDWLALMTAKNKNKQRSLEPWER